MTISPFLRALAVGAFLLLAAPMSYAAVNPPASPGSDVATAKALVEAGKFNEALVLSAAPGTGPQRRCGRAVPHRYRWRSVHRSSPAFPRRAGGAPGRGHRLPAHHPDQSTRPGAGAPGTGAGVLSQGRGQLGARPLRARAGGQTAGTGGGQRATVPGRDPGAPPLDDVSRRRNVAGQQHRRGSDERIIYINDLPFRRDAEELTTSGIGVSVWTGGEYQYPLGDRLRLRLGGDLSRQDYGGSKFDQTSVSVHAGPRWLVDRDTEVSLVGTVRRRWTGTSPYNDDLGARVEAGHRLTPRIRVNGRASWYRRDHRTRDFLDGPILDVTLGGSWVILPILRADGAAGYASERPKSERWRNASRWLRLGASIALPWGFTLGGSGELRWTDYEGNWFPFTRDGAPREDRTRILRATVHNRAFTLYGFSPQLVVTNEARDTNAQLYDYKRTRAELRAVRQF